MSHAQRSCLTCPRKCVGVPVATFIIVKTKIKLGLNVFPTDFISKIRKISLNFTIDNKKIS
jgi:hypothetical protein